MTTKRSKTSSSASTDRVTAYAEAVLAGDIVAGPHVRNACRRHLDDLKQGHERGLAFDLAAADRAIRFFETKLKLSEGQFEGQPLILHPSQAFKVGSLFGWKRADGTRRFRRAYIEEGKGNGKSPIAGGVGLYGMMADGESGAQIYAAGATKDQAGILFRDAVGMVDKSPDLNKRIKRSGGPGREYNLAHLATRSFFRPISRETKKTGSGPRPHFALCDEVHEHPDRGVMEMLERGFKFRRQPLLFMITNSGSDRKSVCWEEHEHAVKVAAGNPTAKDDDPHYLGEALDDTTFSYVCALDKGDDPLNDPTCWPKANPLLGVTITEEYQGVHLTEALDEGNHYHVAWGPKGQSADTLARRQQAATRKDANDDRAYQGQLRQAQDAYSQALLGLGATAQQRYQIAVSQLRGDLALRDRQLDDQVIAGSLSTAEALQLKVIYGMTEQLQEQRAKREEMTSLLDQQLSAARSQLQSDLTLLQLRQQGAVGRAAQYDIARQALAKQQEEDRDALAQRINNSDRNPEDAAKAVQEAQSLPAIQEQQRKNLDKQYQSPLASYKDQLQQNVGSMNDALQGVAVNGLKGIEDGLTGILTGTESVKKAFRSMAASIVSDLIRIGIEKTILSALGNSGGIFGKLFGGGAHADGGLITAGTGPRSDDVLARVSKGEFIVNAASTSKNMHILRAINDNRMSRFADGGLVGGAIPQMRTLSSADVRSLQRPQQPILISVRKGEMFEPYVHGAAAQHAQVAYTNATEDGANLAAQRSAWSAGRSLGGTR